MSEPFIGEIRMQGFAFAPERWAACDGGTVPVAQNPDLAKLLGRTYGGDGVTTVGLPDLRGRLPLHTGDGFPMGATGGAYQHTLQPQEMPEPHVHVAMGTSAAATVPVPGGNVFANSVESPYAKPNPFTALDPSAVPVVGGLPHENTSPYQVVAFCIALRGIMPTPAAEEVLDGSDAG